MSEQVPTPSEHAFKAEIRQLLDILIHSLYTERDIFLRELISNASDALNRLRFEMLTNPEVHNPEAELAIRITVDKEARTLSISDTGVGMTEEELRINLGTIAQSGAREFIQAAKDDGKKDLSDIIGQFGVGFYSSFMVAESVTAVSRSYRPEASAGKWFSAGDDTFQVEPAEREARGTVVTLKLKEDQTDFLEEFKLREIIHKHSDYVAFPIYVGDAAEQVNRQTAIWRRSPSSVEAEEYQEFYKHLTLEFEPPLKHIHLTVDAPLQVYALLYIPSGERGIFSLRKEDGLKLYARKVLIQEYCKDLLPQHLRFIQGVVDAEDLPLNVSREMVQSSALMSRLQRIITSRVTNSLKDMAKDKQNPDVYLAFWKQYGGFVKEGIATLTDSKEREQLYPLLRFHTTTHPEEWVSLDEVIGRMKPEQKKIYYILGEDPHSLIRSPHLDYFNKHGVEVLLMTETIDSFMLMGLQEYEGFAFQNVAVADLELPEEAVPAEGEDAAEKPSLDADQSQALIEQFKGVLGERVTDVRLTNRLSDSVARLVDPEGTMNQEMQRVYKLLEKEYQVPKKILEINPSHTIIQGLANLPADDQRGKLVIEQIYTNALLIEGLLPDPANMIAGIQELMQAALS